VYCVVDARTKDAIENYTPKLKLDIHWVVSLDKYNNWNRAEMEQRGVWGDFQMQKALVIHEALKYEKDTLFLDADILLLDTIDNIDTSKDIGVSPHYISKRDTDTFGYYNGGVVWTNQKGLKDDWIEFTKSSRYFDQASIEDLVNKYDHFEFGEHYNFSWWRVYQSDHPPQSIVSNLSVKDNKIFYKGEALKFVHTHFNENGSDGHLAYIKSFNNLIISALNTIKDYKTLLIIDRMNEGKWEVQLPEQPMSDPWHHVNDSFRELLTLLSNKNPDLDIKLNTQSGHIWLNNNILLYDRPTDDWFNDEIAKCHKMLLGNGDIKTEGSQLQKRDVDVSPWIFWPRRPAILEKTLQEKDILDYDDRKIESVFIGNYENFVQQRFRQTQEDWNNTISEFHCTAGTNHKFTQEEYLEKLRNSKYGLCLRGFGSKCHREVELMAFGTVPVITPEVSIDSYADKPLENVHYIRASTPSEMKEKISQITKDQWKEMSTACYDWYQRNVHSNECWNNMLSSLLYEC